MQDLWGKGKDFIKWLLGRWNDCFTSKPMKNTTTIIEWIFIYKHSCQSNTAEGIECYCIWKGDWMQFMCWHDSVKVRPELKIRNGHVGKLPQTYALYKLRTSNLQAVCLYQPTSSAPNFRWLRDLSTIQHKYKRRNYSKIWGFCCSRTW